MLCALRLRHSRSDDTTFKMKISVIIFALVLVSAFAAAPAATDRAGNIRHANFQASSNVSSSSVSFSSPADKKTPAPTLMRKPKMPTLKPQVQKPVAAAPVKAAAAPVKAAAAPVKNVAAPVKTATAPVKPTCNITVSISILRFPFEVVL